MDESIKVVSLNLNMEQIFRRRDIQQINNELLRSVTDKAKFMGSDEWENNMPQNILNIVDNEMERLNCNLIISCGWLYSFENIIKLFAIYNELAETKRIYIIPELLGLIIAKTQEDLVEYVKSLPKNLIEISIDNINDVKLSDNGIELIYYTKNKFINFETTPEL